VKARRAGTRVVEATVDAAVAGSTAARVAVARLDRTATAVETRRRAAGVEVLAGVTEVRVDADAVELVGRYVDARSTMLAVGPGARTCRLAPLTVVPRGAYTPVPITAVCRLSYT